MTLEEECKMAYTNVDLVSYELKGLAISSSSTPDEDTVQAWIKQAQAEIEAKTGKVWEATSFSSTVLDSDGGHYLKLPWAPVISISSLQYEENGLGSDSESWVSLTQGRTGDYVLYVNDGEIEFTGKSQKPTKGYQNVMVSGVYGYSEVPVKIQRLATAMVAKRVIDATINSSAQEEGGSVTVGNISITDPTVFSVSHSKSMGMEIREMFDELAGSSYVYRPRRVYDLRN
jgi:hypothetical protein